MVRVGLALLAAAPAALGQAPPPGQPAAPPQQKTMDPQLWQHLQDWERVMKGATNFVSEGGTKVERDMRTNTEKVFDATVWCLKPNLARLVLRQQPPPGQKPDPSQAGMYICDGRAVYEYTVREQTVTQYPLGPNGGAGDNLLLEFMGGALTARDVAGRFAIQWLKPDDPNYLILDLQPVRPADQKEFDRLTLVLVRPGLPDKGHQAYLPRTARLMKKNYQESETWDFPDPTVNTTKKGGQPIGPNDFRFEGVPRGWKLVNAAQQRPPAMPPAGPRAAR